MRPSTNSIICSPIPIRLMAPASASDEQADQPHTDVRDNASSTNKHIFVSVSQSPVVKGA